MNDHDMTRRMLDRMRGLVKEERDVVPQEPEISPEIGKQDTGEIVLIANDKIPSDVNIASKSAAESAQDDKSEMDDLFPDYSVSVVKFSVSPKNTSEDPSQSTSGDVVFLGNLYGTEVTFEMHANPSFGMVLTVPNVRLSKDLAQGILDLYNYYETSWAPKWRKELLSDIK